MHTSPRPLLRASHPEVFKHALARMRTAREIYGEYKIMPGLQLHQLRVAAVGKLICEHLKKPVRTKDVVVACLFHDMGNILKFDLVAFPAFTAPEGAAYWELVKAEYREKYGTEQHSATEKIARELKLPQTVLEILGATGFSRIAEVAASGSMETKIVQYADMRVGPFGILPFKERLDDLSRRYAAKKDRLYEEAERGCYDIQQQIFAVADITPEDITDAAVAPLIEELWEYALA